MSRNWATGSFGTVEHATKTTKMTAKSHRRDTDVIPTQYRQPFWGYSAPARHSLKRR